MAASCSIVARSMAGRVATKTIMTKSNGLRKSEAPQFSKMLRSVEHKMIIQQEIPQGMRSFCLIRTIMMTRIRARMNRVTQLLTSARPPMSTIKWCGGAFTATRSPTTKAHSSSSNVNTHAGAVSWFAATTITATSMRVNLSAHMPPK